MYAPPVVERLTARADTGTLERRGCVYTYIHIHIYLILHSNIYIYRNIDISRADAGMLCKEHRGVCVCVHIHSYIFI